MPAKIQWEVGKHTLGEAGQLSAENSHVVQGSMELAAAQLALGMAAAQREPDEEVPSLLDRMRAAEARDLKTAYFEVDTLLTDREREFLPAARVVVGLVQNAATVEVIGLLQRSARRAAQA